MLRRDIGLEMFFKRSLLNTVNRKKLQKMVINIFQHCQKFSMEQCILQFLNILTKSSQIDTERFMNCVVEVSLIQGE